MEQQRRERRSFTDAHKAEVVALCRTSGKSVREISRDLDLTESSVRRWIVQAEIDAGRRDGLTSDERAELSAHSHWSSIARRTATSRSEDGWREPCPQISAVRSMPH